VYVHPDGEEAAMADLEPHVRYFRERCFTLPLPMFFPPGYTAASSYRTRVEIARQLQASGGVTLSAGEPLVGSPEQVGERIARNLDACGAGTLMTQFQVGDMPHGKVMRSMELFAEKVMPYLDRG
jgi:alkanesulfonate monooxygenase SsuD/methylene tetrahydromethanopterin reductase-like flavin-dependent oxidoreductase (luciferase family)